MLFPPNAIGTGPAHEHVSPTPTVITMYAGPLGYGKPTLVSTNYWKCLVPGALHEINGLDIIMNDILADPDVKLEVLRRATLASKLLSHASSVIQNISEDSWFKVGLTKHPVHRWHNSEFGYKHETSPPWQSMKVIALLEHGEAAGIFEAALVSTWSSDPRCLNQAGGGESVPKQAGPFFIYVVVGC